MGKYAQDFKGGKTKQSMAKECDINTIIARAMKAGGLPPAEKIALYADVSSVPDFMEAQNIVARAEAQFMALPALVRDRFNHQPEKFLEFMNDKNNLDEAVKMGLVVKKEIKENKPESPEIAGKVKEEVKKNGLGESA